MRWKCKKVYMYTSSWEREREREILREWERERRKRREHSQEEYVSRKTSRLDSPTPRFQVVFLTLSYLLLPWYLFYCISVIYQDFERRHLTSVKCLLSKGQTIFFGFVFWLTVDTQSAALWELSTRSTLQISMYYLLVEYVYYCCINAKLRSRRIAVSSG